MSNTNNNEVKNLSDQELVSLIRENELKDFTQSLNAFKLLKERKYNQKKLEEERDRVLDLMDEEIFEFTSIEKEHVKKKKDMKSSIYYALGITIISIMIYIQNQKGLAIDKQPPLFLYIAITAVFIAFLVYKVMGFKKSQEIYNQLDLEKKETLLKQLELLEEI